MEDLTNNKIQLKILEDVEFKNPIVVEGLPGIGFVGKIVLDQIIEHTDAIKFAEIRSHYFPPQVTIKTDGLIAPMTHDLYYIKDFGEDKCDVILLLGNAQATEFEGQIEISEWTAKYLNNIGTEKIYTIGGIGIGKPIEGRKKVFTAANNKEILDEVLEIDNVCVREEENGAIVGESGLLLQFAEEFNIPAACLMGETPGFYLDPEAAKEVLLVLFEILKFNIDFEDLEEKMKFAEERIALNPQLNQLMTPQQQEAPSDDLHYIG